MIRHIRWRRGPVIQVLIDQACFGISSIDDLTDDALIALHQAMERGESCIREGVSFEDAGLLKEHY